MKHHHPWPLLALCLLVAVHAPAAVRYVDLNSVNPTPPYTNLATAATNIQDAVDAAIAGDEVLVTNGVYAAGGGVAPGESAGNNFSRVTLRKPVSVRSVNGPEFTVIQGGISTRCAYLRDDNASLSGFTLTNGAPSDFLVATLGGGVYCWGTNAVVSNCVIVGCSATYGGGVYGERGSRIINCIVISNSADYGGGVAGNQAGFIPPRPGCNLMNCTVANNSARVLGGGAWGRDSFGRCLLVNCTLTNNWADIVGAATYQCSLSGCLVSRNHHYDGDASVYLSRLTNCLITTTYGSAADNSQLYNCTLANNAGGLIGGCTLRNCLIYESSYDASTCTLNYCCTPFTPASGVGNIAAEPQQLIQADGNLRLQTNSPCINSGFNGYAPIGPDLDGNPRIVGETVDIGAYEFQSPSSLLSYAWAQQHGLTTDGSADYSDSDADLLNNWQEWIAGTVPTNAASVLRLLVLTPDESGVTVRWQSVATRNYFLERRSDLRTPAAFSITQTNIPGHAGETVFTDTNAAGPGPFFYRVGIQP